MTLRELEELFADASFVAEPASLAAAVGADPDGVRLSMLLVVKLRFERLLRGSSEAERAFDAAPASFTREFDRYIREVPPTAFTPQAEARLYREWQDLQTSGQGDR